MNAAMKAHISGPTIKAGEVDFSRATPVISGAQKFVVPVPEFPEGGEPLVYPEGHEHEGEPILCRDKKRIGERGVVFWNAKDSCWQAAADEGTHVVILNQVSEREATLLLERFSELGGRDRITHAGYKDFLAYAAAIGLADAYQSDREYVRAYLTPVMADALQFEDAGVTMGFLKRNDRAVALALYKEGPFKFVNARGVTQELPDGGVIVRLGDAIHAVQPDIFRQTYRLAEDGRQVQDLGADIASARLTGT